MTERFLDKIEGLAVWRAAEPSPVPVSRLADLLSLDAEAVELAEHLAGMKAPEMAPLVAELVKGEHVPCAAGARYTESGLRKRASWESTWDLQRKEDAIDALAASGRISESEAADRKRIEVGEIPVPPKYDSKDFRSASYWQCRGKLDVAKERFISYPGVSGDRPAELVIGWAGWDQYGQAKALVSLIDGELEAGGGRPERLLPLLQGLHELLPWLSQWFGDDPEFGDLGAVYREAWLDRVVRSGTTVDAVLGWRAPAGRRGRGPTLSGRTTP